MKRIWSVLAVLLTVCLTLTAVHGETYPGFSDGSCEAKEALNSNNGMHYWQFDHVSEATCTQAGAEYYRCIYCGQTRKINGEAALGHLWYDGGITREPTCAEPGVKVYYCERCQEQKTETIPAAGHVWGDWTVTAQGTCSKKAVLTRTCSVCGESETKDGDYGGHSWGDWTTTAQGTCSQKAVLTRTCSVCGESETKDGDYGDHNWIGWFDDIAGNCVTKSMQYRKCTICGKMEGREGDYGDHMWSDWTVSVPGTCTQKAVLTRTCSICGKSETKEGDTGSHTWSDWSVTTPGSCTVKAVLTRTCSVCGKAETKEGDTAAHTWGEWATISDGTCVKAALQYHICLVCGQTEYRDGDLGDHQFGSWITERNATCLQSELFSRTCGVCGAKEYREGSYGDHRFGAWERDTAGTCLEKSRQHRTCEDCGYVQYTEGDFGPHQYGRWIVDEKGTCVKKELVRRHCSVCGSIDWRYRQYGDHVWGDWEEVREPSPEGPGLRRRVCKLNKSHVEEEEIPYTAGPVPQVRMILSYDSAAPYRKGDSFTVTLTVENTGNLPLTYKNHLSDVPATEGDALAALPSSLAHGEAWTAEHTVIVTEDDYLESNQPAPGEFGRRWEVTYAYDDLTARDECRLQEKLDTVSTGIGGPGDSRTGIRIGVTMTSEAKALYEKGDLLTFDVDLTNESSFSFTDSHLMLAYLADDGNTLKALYYDTENEGVIALEAGETVTFHVSYTVRDEDAAMGQQTLFFYGADYNLPGEYGYDPEAAVVSGHIQNDSIWSDDWQMPFDVAAAPASDPDSATLLLDVQQISAVKEEYSENDVLAFDVSLINKGGTPLEACLISFIGPEADESAEMGTIDSGSRSTFTFFYTVTSADAAAGSKSLTWTGYGLLDGWEDVEGLNEADPHWITAEPVSLTLKAAKDESTPSYELLLEVRARDEKTAYELGPSDMTEVIYYDVAVTNVGKKPVDVKDYDLMVNGVSVSFTGPVINLYPGESTALPQGEYAYKRDEIVPFTAAADTLGDVEGVFIAYAYTPYTSARCYISGDVTVTHHIIESVLPTGETPSEMVPDDFKVTKEEISAPLNPEGYREGEQIDYVITVENLSDTEISPVRIFDVLYSNEETGDNSYMLLDSVKPHEVLSISFSYTVTGFDVDFGFVQNKAYASWIDPGTGKEIQSHSNKVISLTSEAPVSPITVTKAVDDSPENGIFYAEGEEIHFVITVNNNSDHPVSDVTLYDSLFQSEIAPGIMIIWPEIPAHGTEIWHCYYTVTELDALGLSLTNIAAIEAYDHNGNYVCVVSDPVEVPTGTEKSSDALTVTKTETSHPANGEYYEPGETIGYEITVENTGSADLYDVIIADNQSDTFMGEIDALTELRIGEKHTVSYSHTVDELDLTYGYVMNYAIVYYMLPDNVWYTVVESEPVYSSVGVPQSSGRAPQPTPRESVPDSCKRTLLADGDYRTEYSLHICAEHKAIEDTLSAALRFASTPEEEVLIWRKAGQMWRDAMDKEYQRLYEVLGSKGKEAAVSDRLAFINYLDTLEALLTQAGGAEEPEAVKAVATAAMNRTADLCWLNAHMGESRPDSHMTARYAVLIGTEPADICVLTDTAANDGIRRSLILDETHGRIHSSVLSLFDGALTRDSLISAWQRGRRMWQSDLDGLTNQRYKTADAAGRKIIAANRTAFDRYLNADTELLNALYPNHPEFAWEFTQQAMMNHVVLLCGLWTEPDTKTGTDDKPAPAPDTETTPEPPAPGPEVTPLPAAPEPGEDPNSDGSLVVQVWGEDSGNYTVQITLYNSGMTFNPKMDIQSGRYGTFRRAGGDYTLRIMPKDGTRILTVDGEEAETDETGAYERTVTMRGGNRIEVNVVVGASDR